LHCYTIPTPELLGAARAVLALRYRLIALRGAFADMAVRRLWLFVTLLAALVLPSACRVNTDLGRSCQLVKKNPDGGTSSVPIVEADLPSATKAFISFGATECEELVCVRDAYVPRPGVATAPAPGYCSRSCVANSSTACPAANPEDNNDPTRKLSCRAL